MILAVILATKSCRIVQNYWLLGLFNSPGLEDFAGIWLQAGKLWVGVRVNSLTPYHVSKPSAKSPNTSYWTPLPESCNYPTTVQNCKVPIT